MVEKVSIWRGTLTAADLNSRVCPSSGTYPQWGYTCPSYKSGRVFIDEDYCPDCGTPLETQVFEPRRRLIWSTEPDNVPTSCASQSTAVSIYGNMEIFNPNFEEWTAGYPDHWTYNTAYLTEPAQVIEGDGYSLRVMYPTAGERQWLSNAFPLVPSQNLQCSISVKEDPIMSFKNGDLQATLVPDDWDFGDDVYHPYVPVVTSSEATASWATVAFELENTDLKRAKFLLSLTTKGGSYVLVDNVELRGLRSNDGVLNGQFMMWSDGATPDHWHISGAATISANTTAYRTDGPYCLEVTGTSINMYTGTGADDVGYTYTVNAYAKADIPNVVASLSVLYKSDPEVETPLGNVTLTSDYTEITGDFVLSEDVDTQIRLHIIATATATVYVDDVSVEKEPSSVWFNLDDVLQQNALDWLYSWTYRQYPVGCDSLATGTITSATKTYSHLHIEVYDADSNLTITQTSYEDPMGFEIQDFSGKWVEFPIDGITSVPCTWRYINHEPLVVGDTYAVRSRVIEYDTLETVTVLVWSVTSSVTISNVTTPTTVWPTQDGVAVDPIHFDPDTEGYYYLYVVPSVPMCDYNGQGTCDNPVVRGAYTGYGIDPNALDRPDGALDPYNMATSAEVTAGNVYKGGEWDYDDNGDGDTDRTSPRGVCFNSECDGYAAQSVGTDLYCIRYNEDRPVGYNFDTGFGMNPGWFLVCVNNEIDTATGTFVCENYRRFRPVAPDYKICGRHSSTAFGEQFKYDCNLYDGTYSAGASADATAWDHTAAWDNDGEHVPNPYRWPMQTDMVEWRSDNGLEPVDLCPGVLLTGARCNYPLEPLINTIQLCQFCGEPLVRFWNQSRTVEYKICTNDAKGYTNKILCETGYNRTLLSATATVCPECGADTIPSTPPPVVSVFASSGTSVELSATHTTYLKEGEKYSWSHITWTTSATGTWDTPQTFRYEALSDRYKDYLSASITAYDATWASCNTIVTNGSDLQEMQYIRNFNRLRAENYHKVINKSCYNSAEHLLMTDRTDFCYNVTPSQNHGTFSWQYDWNVEFDVDVSGTTCIQLSDHPHLNYTDPDPYAFSWVQSPFMTQAVVNDVDSLGYSCEMKTSIMTENLSASFSIGFVSEEIFVNDAGIYWSSGMLEDKYSWWKRCMLEYDGSGYSVKVTEERGVIYSAVVTLPGGHAANTWIEVKGRRLKTGQIVFTVTNLDTMDTVSASVSAGLFEANRFAYWQVRENQNGPIYITDAYHQFPRYQANPGSGSDFDVIELELSDGYDNAKALVQGDTENNWSSTYYEWELGYDGEFENVVPSMSKLRAINQDGWACWDLHGEYATQELIGGVSPKAGEYVCRNYGKKVSDTEATEDSWRCPVCDGPYAAHYLGMDSESLVQSEFEDVWGHGLLSDIQIESDMYPGENDPMFIDLDCDGVADCDTMFQPIEDGYFNMPNSEINSTTTPWKTYRSNTELGFELAPDSPRQPLWNYASIRKHLFTKDLTDIRQAVDLHIWVSPITNDPRHGIHKCQYASGVYQDIDISGYTSDQRESLKDTIVEYYLPSESTYPATRYEVDGLRDTERRVILRAQGYTSGNLKASLDFILYSSQAADNIRQGVAHGIDEDAYITDGVYYLQQWLGDVNDLDRWLRKSVDVDGYITIAEALLDLSVDTIRIMPIVTIRRDQAETDDVSVETTVRAYIKCVRVGWKNQVSGTQRLYTASDFNTTYFWRVRPVNLKPTRSYTYSRLLSRKIDYLTDQYRTLEEPYSFSADTSSYTKEITPLQQRKFYRRIGEYQVPREWKYNDIIRGYEQQSNNFYKHTREVL